MVKGIGDILNRLQKARPLQNGEYIALCPAHDDNKQSLTLKQDGEAILLHCQAGCSPELVCEAIGITTADLFVKNDNLNKERKIFPPTPPYRKKETPPVPTPNTLRLIKTYDYINEDEVLLYQVCRYEPKSFRQRRPNGSDWSWNLNSTRRVIYNLPQVIKADIVYHVEGEKDADNLVKCNRIATTSCGGASGWRSEYADFYTGKKVVIIPDNDTPGYQYARNVAASLQGKAREIKVILLDDAKDITEWLEAGGNPDELGGMEQELDAINAKSANNANTAIDAIDAIDSNFSNFSKNPNNDKPYQVIARLVREYLTLHVGERFDLDTICRQLSITERDSRKYVCIELARKVEQGKLEKVSTSRGTLYIVLNNTLVYINDWIDANDDEIVSVRWPVSHQDATEFGFEKTMIVPSGGLIVIAGVSNMGKALKDGTPVLTPDGWKCIEEMNIGDSVFTEDGEVTKVIGVFPQGIREVYRLIFNDGSWIDCDKQHIWKVQTGHARTHKLTGHGNPSSHFKEWTFKTTEELLSICGQGDIVPSRRFTIPTVKPIEFKSSPVPLPPYLLGLLLGDGCFKKSCTMFTTADIELLDTFRDYGIIPKYVGRYDYSLRGLLPAIKEFGLSGLGSHKKFIPKIYLYNDQSVRLAILRGLLDTDGSIDKNGEVEYSSVSEQLASDVVWLVRSLGGRASIHKGKSSHVYKGVRTEGIRYRVNIKVPFCPFQLRIKADKFRPYAKTYNRVIRRIDRMPDSDCTCIKVASPGGLFVAKDFIVTHNTGFLQNVCVENCEQYHVTMMINEANKSKFKRRIQRMTWFNPRGEDGKVKFDLIERHGEWKYAVQPDDINIIDWIDLPDGDFYKINGILDGIKSRLGKGVAFVALQKSEGKALGTGGQFSEHLADIYLNIDFQRLTVRKCKEWNAPNPNNKMWGFEIVEGGSQFADIREIKLCPRCGGRSLTAHTHCEDCKGTGYIDKI
jgi:hypothetical protein